MIDIIPINNKDFLDFDFENGDLKTTFDLKTAILMSIFCEKRAEQVQQFDGKRGHFANQFNLVDGYEVGSLYWLYTEQNKVSEDNKDDLQDTITEGLQWLIDDNLLTEIDCNINIVNNAYTINITTIDNFNKEQSYSF